MVNVLFDTNILIDYLNGIEQAKAELNRHADKAIRLNQKARCASQVAQV